VLLALRHRARTGQGCQVESIMVETSLAVAAEQVAEHSTTGELLVGDGNRSLRAEPQGLYVCSDPAPDGGPRWLAVSVRDDAQWNALAHAIGREDLAGRSFDQRRASREEIDAALGAWAAAHEADDAARRLCDRGVPAARVVGTRRAHELEPLADSDFYETVEHAMRGAVPVAALPLRFGRRERPWFAGAAPMLGEHNREVLTRLAGLDDTALDRLAAAERIGNRPKGL
jgi:crotonobetainyl-CoA:carnitine CoA-transferase CaiB-like acyl-CoA transferase